MLTRVGDLILVLDGSRRHLRDRPAHHVASARVRVPRASPLVLRGGSGMGRTVGWGGGESAPKYGTSPTRRGRVEGPRRGFAKMRRVAHLARLHAAVCALARAQTKPDIARSRVGNTGEWTERWVNQFSSITSQKIHHRSIRCPYPHTPERASIRRDVRRLVHRLDGGDPSRSSNPRRRHPRPPRSIQSTRARHVHHTRVVVVILRR